MIHVPAGEYSIGSTEGRADEQPVHTIVLEAFDVDEFVLTINETVELLGPEHSNLPIAWRSHPPEPGDFPATRLRRREAEAIGRRMGKRLPTEIEFEVASRYLYARKPERAIRCQGSKPLPLMTSHEARRRGLSTNAGLIAMSGLVWQWTSSSYAWYPGTAQRQRPALPSGWAVVRGGIWSSYDSRPSLRSFRDPDCAYTRVGVRFVCDSHLT